MQHYVGMKINGDYFEYHPMFLDAEQYGFMQHHE